MLSSKNLNHIFLKKGISSGSYFSGGYLNGRVSIISYLIYFDPGNGGYKIPNSVFKNDN